MKKIPLLYYTDQGTGPVVVLLHGYMASSQYWQRVVDDLAQRHRVIALDLLGFGKSPKPSCSKYDYEAQIASIDHTLMTLEVTEPVILVGHSMGSLVALRYARQHQTGVSKLVLTNMPIFLNYQEAKNSILSHSIFYYVGMRPGLHAVVWPLFKTITRLRLLPTRIGGDAASRRAYMFQSTGTSRLRSLRNVIYSAKIEADLAALSVTTVLLSGIHDQASYIKNLTSLRLKTHMRSLSVPGGHHLPITNPELITQLI
jgi:pimeloyl-ACP methyl ester carboxylesterase